jgi:cell division protein FtsB
MLSSIKIKLIIIGVILVLFGLLSIFLYGSIKNNHIKQAKIEKLNSEIVKNKANCDIEKLELIEEIAQLEKNFMAKSIEYSKEQERKNKTIKEVVIVEKETNKEIIEQAKNEKSFNAIWVRINDLLQL